MTEFGYDDENRPTSLSYGDHGESTLEYDGLGRVAKATVKAGSGTANETAYTYVAGAELEDVTDKTSTTGLVKKIEQTGGTFEYQYDDNGNITSVKQDGVTTSYTYDALGQLTRVDDAQENATWVYTYDQGGNILSKKKYALGVTSGTAAESKVFTYGNANWRDQLTAVDGVVITYDAIGNPLNDGTWQYEWVNGRQLARIYSVDTDACFVYNENGLRVQKMVNGVVTKYTLHGKDIKHMSRGSDELHFFYDAQNKPAVVVYNGTPYSYVKNLQGDIVAILNSAGTAVVNYVYDAWGRPISKTGSMADTLGSVQPFRYRGYVYDEETGLYYLRSRYYNPRHSRFICADCLIAGNNLYAYCSNRPVYMSDSSGLEERRSETSGDITNFIREGFWAIELRATVYESGYFIKKEIEQYMLFIPYNHVQYYNNAVLFETASPIDKLGRNAIDEVISAGQDSAVELVDELIGKGRAFSLILSLMGLAKEYIDDAAESAQKADHKAAAQAASDNQSYMVVVITKTRTSSWIKEFWRPGYYGNARTTFVTQYYELSEYFNMDKE